MLASVANAGRRPWYRDESVELLVAMMIVSTWVVTLVGACLGIAGLCQPKRRKAFAGVGLFLNLSVLVLPFALVLLGIAASVTFR
jgi:hypothetical protein